MRIKKITEEKANAKIAKDERRKMRRKKASGFPTTSPIKEKRDGGDDESDEDYAEAPK